MPEESEKGGAPKSGQIPENIPLILPHLSRQVYRSVYMD